VVWDAGWSRKNGHFLFRYNCYKRWSFPKIILPGVEYYDKFLLRKAFSKCSLYSSLVLVITKMFEPNPSQMDHSCHSNIKIVQNSLEHVSWNSSCFPPVVCLKFPNWVRVIIVATLLHRIKSTFILKTTKVARWELTMNGTLRFWRDASFRL